MQSLLAVEMRSLGHYLALLAEQDRYARDLRRPDLAAALVETTACMPVYRSYIQEGRIAYVKVGGTYRIDENTIKEMLSPHGPTKGFDR